MGKTARILVVEDEANERTGLAELLQAWGYETETAGQRRRGPGEGSTFSPDVILSDLRMPAMTGMELCGS